MNSTTVTRVKLCPSFGMEAELRMAWSKLERLCRSSRVGVAGRFVPDRGSSRRLGQLGAVEDIDVADAFRFDRVVIPWTGIPVRERKLWEESGVRLLDLTSPHLRRAQVALGLLKMGKAQPLVIGRHGDAESRTLKQAIPGALVIEETTDTARLGFAPSFGVVCQPTLSPRRVAWLVQQLRFRYRDAVVDFLDTLSPGMQARATSLEKYASQAEHVVIVGDADEASCLALAEVAARAGRPAEIAATPDELRGVGRGERIVLTAGAFATDEAIHAIAQALKAF